MRQKCLAASSPSSAHGVFSQGFAPPAEPTSATANLLLHGKGNNTKQSEPAKQFKKKKQDSEADAKIHCKEPPQRKNLDSGSRASMLQVTSLPITVKPVLNLYLASSCPHFWGL